MFLAIDRDHEPILCWCGDHCGHLSDRGPFGCVDPEPDEVIRPVLALFQPTLGGMDVPASDGLHGFPVVEALERDLIPLVAATNPANGVALGVDENERAGLDVGDVRLIDIDADVAVQPVRPTEPADTGVLSRGTRRQRRFPLLRRRRRRRRGLPWPPAHDAR